MMYIYLALTNALRAHIIHINLNTIFYTYVEDSPTKTICIRQSYQNNLHKALYGNTHTHTHTHTRTHAHTHTHTLTVAETKSLEY